MAIDPVAAPGDGHRRYVVGPVTGVGVVRLLSRSVLLARHASGPVVDDVLELVVAFGILDRLEVTASVIGERPRLPARVGDARQVPTRVAVLDGAPVGERDLADQGRIGDVVAERDRAPGRVSDRGELAARVGERGRRPEARLHRGQLPRAVEEEGALVARDQLVGEIGEAVEGAVEALPLVLGRSGRPAHLRKARALPGAGPVLELARRRVDDRQARLEGMRPADAESRRGRVLRIVGAQPVEGDARAAKAKIAGVLGQRSGCGADREECVGERVSKGGIERECEPELVALAAGATPSLLIQEAAETRRRRVEVEVGLLVGRRIDEQVVVSAADDLAADDPD